MTFSAEPTKTPTSIGNMVVVLKDVIEDDPAQTAHVQVRVIMSDGSVVVRKDDLVPHITSQQRQGLMDFMDSLRAQAEQQIL